MLEGSHADIFIKLIYTFSLVFVIQPITNTWPIFGPYYEIEVVVNIFEKPSGRSVIQGLLNAHSSLLLELIVQDLCLYCLLYTSDAADE